MEPESRAQQPGLWRRAGSRDADTAPHLPQIPGRHQRLRPLQPIDRRQRSTSHLIARRGTTFVGSGLIAIATLTVALVVTAVGGGLNDSGWTVAKPKTVLDEHPANDPEMRIAINQVLEQSKVPLLVVPAPKKTAALQPESQAESEPDLQQRAPSTAAADGWRRVQSLQ